MQQQTAAARGWWAHTRLHSMRDTEPTDSKHSPSLQLSSSPYMTFINLCCHKVDVTADIHKRFYISLLD